MDEIVDPFLRSVVGLNGCAVGFLAGKLLAQGGIYPGSIECFVSALTVGEYNLLMSYLEEFNPNEEE